MVMNARKLADGNAIPRLGLGTWPMDDEQSEVAVKSALGLGYRLVDTAARYGNETGVGRAIAGSDVPREEVFVTSKLRGSQHGYEPALAGFEESRRRLGLEYLDLFLIHWPLPQQGLYVETWKAFVHLRDEGLVRSIGVSNFTAEQIKTIAAETGEWPAVNQIEIHPDFPQNELREWQTDKGVVTEAWSPLGAGGDLLTNAQVEAIAKEHDRSPGQVILRWHLEVGNVPIPKSSRPQRQAENLDVFSFRLTDAEMRSISELDTGNRLGGDPDTHVEL